MSGTEKRKQGTVRIWGLSGGQKRGNSVGRGIERKVRCALQVLVVSPPCNWARHKPGPLFPQVDAAMGREAGKTEVGVR